MGTNNDVRLQVAYAPYDPSKTIAELSDDDLMVCSMVGPKHSILAIVEALASFSLEDEINGLL